MRRISKVFYGLLLTGVLFLPLMAGCGGGGGGGEAVSDTTAPSVPTGLMAASISGSSIRLDWQAATDDVGVAGYKIYRNGAYLKSVNTISTTDSGLSFATQYCYTVSAYDAAGNESDQSSQACATPDIWTTELVDSADKVGFGASIALDSNNKVHISYYDSTNNYLKYATNTSGSWITTIIDTAAINEYDAYSSIAVDSNNKVHISYYDNASYNLKYATNASGSWVTAVISSAGYIGYYNSIAIDSNNKVHMGFADSTYPGGLKYVTNASGSWVETTVDTGESYRYIDIAIDSNNKAHMSYSTGVDSLKYATNDTGSWVTTTLDGGSYTSIAIDSNSKAHISYFNYDRTRLKYATNASGSWVTIDLPSSGNAGHSTSIAIDSNNKCHISYMFANAGLLYATNTSGTWVANMTVDHLTPHMGYYGSMAVDSNNKLHIGYYDYTYSNLKYATNQ